MKTSTNKDGALSALALRLVRLAWVPCYQYALAERSRVMLWIIWCVFARIDTDRPFYAPALRPWLWKCRKCGKTFPRNRSFSTTTHNDSECTTLPNAASEPRRGE